MDVPLISVVIASLNGEQYVPACVQSLLKCGWAHLEIILVDNGSGPQFAAMAGKLPQEVIQLRLEHNSGFSGLVTRYRIS